MWHQAENFAYLRLTTILLLLSHSNIRPFMLLHPVPIPPLCSHISVWPSFPHSFPASGHFDPISRDIGLSCPVVAVRCFHPLLTKGAKGIYRNWESTVLQTVTAAGGSATREEELGVKKLEVAVCTWRETGFGAPPCRLLLLRKSQSCQSCDFGFYWESLEWIQSKSTQVQKWQCRKVTYPSIRLLLAIVFK